MSVCYTKPLLYDYVRSGSVIGEYEIAIYRVVFHLVLPVKIYVANLFVVNGH